MDLIDPDGDARERSKIASEAMTRALHDSVSAGLAQALARMLARDHGPGPWLLHRDGRVTEP